MLQAKVTSIVYDSASITVFWQILDNENVPPAKLSKVFTVNATQADVDAAIAASLAAHDNVQKLQAVYDVGLFAISPVSSTLVLSKQAEEEQAELDNVVPIAPTPDLAPAPIDPGT